MLNYFHLFNVPQSYFVDEVALRQAYQRLQAQYHPDRHVRESAQEQHRILALAADINAGWQCLSSPVARAGHLLELRGVDVSTPTMALDEAFLEHQIAWRERIEEAQSLADLEALRVLLLKERDEEGQVFAAALSRDDVQGARRSQAALQFFGRLLDELRQHIDHLDAVF